MLRRPSLAAPLAGTLRRRRAAALLALAGACAAPPRVAFVTGDDEYRSEITMPAIAAILEARGLARCEVAYAANPETGARDPKDHRHLEGLEALDRTDAAVFFLRFREVPDAELERIVGFAQSGKPVVGLRTTTHAFAYAEGPASRWNDGFGLELFGQRWLHHHGHDSTTEVTVVEPHHPILRGVDPTFPCASWLYEVKPLPADCRVLAVGDARRGSERFGERNPVAWTRERGGRRVFFTTLGHPSDFEHLSVRRLVVQGILWALRREAEIPRDGIDVTVPGGYAAPPTH